MALVALVILTKEESENLLKLVGKYVFESKNPTSGLHILQGFYWRDDIISGSSNKHPMSPSIYNGIVAEKYIKPDISKLWSNVCVDCDTNLEKFISIYNIEKDKYNNRNK